MKQTMEYFGASIVAVLVATALFGILWKLPLRIGERVLGQVEVSKEAYRNESFETYMQNPLWEIRSGRTNLCFVRQRCRAKEIVSVRYRGMENCTLHFCGVLDDKQAEYFMMSDDGTQCMFLKAGRYQLRMKATAADGTSCYFRFMVVVNKIGGE